MIPMTLALLLAQAAPLPPSGKNAPDEPLAAAFSMPKALEFLDHASIRWQQSRKCMTCHTDYAYLWTVPQVEPGRPAIRKLRDYAEDLVRERWVSKGPRWDAEVVMTASTLAMLDRTEGKGLQELTRKALDRMWTVQRPDGGWSWLKCEWPPMEIDDHYGATVALIGAGAAPGDYASTPAAKAGIEKARRWLAANPPPGLHHEAMLAWAATLVDGIQSPEARLATARKLLARQLPDGGVPIAALGPLWKRKDGSAQTLDAGDGYGTGFALVVARLCGVPAGDPAVKKGADWIRSHQRESGRWFTRSLFEDNHHFISHAGTAYAVLALHLCKAD